MNLKDIERAEPLFTLRRQIVGIDRQVPVLDGSTCPYTNLDNAASTPVLREVLETVERFMEWYASVHRGTGFKSRLATQAYEDARRIVARLRRRGHARPRRHLRQEHHRGDQQAVVPAAAAARRRGAGVAAGAPQQRSALARDEGPRGARRLRRPGGLDEAHFDRLLAEHAGRVKLVAVTGGSNVTGHMPDVHRLAEKAHAAGAQIFVDCAQLAPHRAIDIGALDDPAHLDYVALSAHKMYAPFGTGALIGRRDTFEHGEPEQRGGGTVEIVTLDDVDGRRRPTGTRPAARTWSARWRWRRRSSALQRIGMDAVARHESELTAYALERLAASRGCASTATPTPRTPTERLGVITFNLDGLSHQYVAAVLGTEFGIGVRNGCFCAHPYLMRLLGLSPAEVQRLSRGHRRRRPPRDAGHGAHQLRLVQQLPRHRPRWPTRCSASSAATCSGDYVQDRASGEYAARGWAPDLSAYFSLATPPDALAGTARDITAKAAA